MKHGSHDRAALFMVLTTGQCGSSMLQAQSAHCVMVKLLVKGVSAGLSKWHVSGVDFG